MGIGPTDRSQWNDVVRLSRDACGTTAASPCPGYKNGAAVFSHLGRLDVNGGYARSVDLKLPLDLEGTVYFHVSTGGPFEFIYNDNNSATSAPIDISLAPVPDLAVVQIAAPETAGAGQSIDVEWTVRNDGASGADGTWTDKLFLRKAGDPAAAAIPLGVFTFRGQVQPGTSYTRRELVKVPVNVTGLFQVVVVTNSGETLSERGQTDNNTVTDDTTLLISFPPHADLRVDSILVADTVDAGSTTAVEFVVTNRGGASTSGNWTDRVYLSLDDRLTSDDILLAVSSNGSALDKDQSYRTLVEDFQIPSRFRGEVFVIATTDHDDAVEEFDGDRNNLLAQPLTINPLPAADLVVTEVTAPAQAFDGSTIEVRYRVTNDGVGPTDVDAWTDSIWLTRDKDRPNPGSRENPQDYLLGSFNHEGPLAIDGTYERTVSVTLPDYVSGEWYITPWSDAYDTVLEETFEPNPDDPHELDGNNYKSRPVTVLLTPPADLVVRDVQAISEANGGQPFSLRWTVVNQGLDTTDRSDWGDRVWLTNGDKTWPLDTIPHLGLARPRPKLHSGTSLRSGSRSDRSSSLGGNEPSQHSRTSCLRRSLHGQQRRLHDHCGRNQGGRPANQHPVSTHGKFFGRANRDKLDRHKYRSRDLGRNRVLARLRLCVGAANVGSRRSATARQIHSSQRRFAGRE